jgi:hypothetical protein
MKNANFSNKLVLKNNPIRETFLSGLITIIIAAASLTVTYSSLPKSSLLSCNRTAGNEPNCELRETTLFLGSQQETFLNQLTGVIVAPSSGGGDSEDVSVVILKTADSGNFSLMRYESESKAESIASQINVFIANQKQNNLQITITSELKIMPLLIGLLFLTIALAILISIIIIPFYRKITLDKTTNQIIIHQIGLLKNQITTYKISDVNEIRKEETIDKSDDSKIEYVMLLSGNKRINLSLYHGRNYKNELAMIENLATFLNLQITHQQIKE